MIRFRCKQCGRKISVTEVHAGKKGKCPKCKSIVIVPQMDNAGSAKGQTNSANSKTSPNAPGLDPALFDIPKKNEDRIQSCLEDDEFDKGIEEKLAEQTTDGEQKMERDETEPIAKSRLPWFINAILYPVSISGLIRIVIFIVMLFGIRFLGGGVIGDWLGDWPVGMILVFLLYLLYVGYVFSYIGYCIFDSSKGGLRAPDISGEPAPDKSDLVWQLFRQLFLILGSIVVCFGPTALYYVFTKQTDLFFWLLLVIGIPFFPMSLLAVVLFDSLDILNPVMIIRSILRTFPRYCGLILMLCFFAGIVVGIDLISKRLPFFISKVVFFYLSFVAAHLLGRFYWWNKDKLDWGI